MYKKILLPTDGFEATEKAAEYVISSKSINNADIFVLNVINSNLLNALPQVSQRKTLINHLCAERKEAVEKFKKKIEDVKCADNGINIKMITMVKIGNPKDVIINTAKELNVDQILMAKSNKNGLERLLLGSTSEKVAREAKVPVTIIS